MIIAVEFLGWFVGRSFPWARRILAVWFAFTMSASDPHLHPLGRAVDPGEIQFTLRKAAMPGESYAVECVYRPWRARDVKKSRHLNLFGGWIGGGSPGLIKVQREEFHSVRHSYTATGSDMKFTVSLRDPDSEYRAYQLETVRVVGRVSGTVEFERWFVAMPNLDPGFGFECGATALHGAVRPSGLGAQPLRGSLPLWSTLRWVELEWKAVEVPVLRVFEATSKHHWEGWRQTTPHSWPGGRTIVVRQVGDPTVWREHEYHAFPPAGEPLELQLAPPQGVMAGVHLEIFWPEGDSLEFPETNFERDVEMMAVPVSKLPGRMRELLGQSVRLRPGWESSSISAEEWKEMEALVPERRMPLAMEMAPSGSGGKARLKMVRLSGFSEPWVWAFGTVYDDNRRYRLTTLLITPERWRGSLPE